MSCSWKGRFLTEYSHLKVWWEKVPFSKWRKEFQSYFLQHICSMKGKEMMPPHTSLQLSEQNTTVCQHSSPNMHVETTEHLFYTWRDMTHNLWKSLPDCTGNFILMSEYDSLWSLCSVFLCDYYFNGSTSSVCSFCYFNISIPLCDMVIKKRVFMYHQRVIQ